MWQSTQKQVAKFCTSKRAENGKTHPEKPEKGKTGCVLGAGEGCSRCGRVKKPGIRTKVNPKTILHMKKENRQKRSVSAGFWQGQKDLSRLPPRVLLPNGERPAPTEAGAETGAAERHWRSLTPRHALRRAQPCLVAKSYRTLPKKSGTAQAIPDFFGRGRRT